MTARDFHTLQARRFAHALVSAGARHAVISPGSRSTPLALALSGEKELHTTVVVDERSGAFVALGQARVTGLPSILLATSGSAGAHYFPAILEAERARIPMIAVTADRPWELTDANAAQTLDQTKLFGTHVRASFELGVPDQAGLDHVPRIAAHAMQAALSPLPGPVHVNARFRKPLEPIGVDHDPCVGQIGPRVFLPELIASSAGIAHLADLIGRSKRGALVAGPAYGFDSDCLAQSVARFIERSGFALFAEATSGLAFHPESAKLVIASPEIAVHAGWFIDLLAPDLVIEIGHPPTSGAYSRVARRLRRVLVAPDGVPDPHANAESVVIGDAAQVLSKLTAEIAPRQRTHPQVGVRIDDGPLTEPRIARRLAAALPTGSLLVCGNSLVVRDLDAFASPAPSSVRVLHQRGLAGIDGLIAGAVGARSALPPEIAVTALIGDVAAMHDIGSLGLCAGMRGALVLVIVDNRGGRIFSELPIAKAPEIAPDFARLFLTPPAVALADVARAFGVDCCEVTSSIELGRALSAAFDAKRPSAIVAQVDPLASARHRTLLFDALRDPRRGDSMSSELRRTNVINPALKSGAL